MKENYQKIKLLKLMELLRQETDELHALSTNEICSRLSAIGISCERRTLAKDIALLNEQGFEVMSCRVGKEKGYYIADRSFSIPPNYEYNRGQCAPPPACPESPADRNRG